MYEDDDDEDYEAWIWLEIYYKSFIFLEIMSILFYYLIFFN